MISKKITNILVCGIGGQGVMTAAEIIAQAAVSIGLDAKKTEVAGMAQRGGVVTSHIRFGEKVLSPAINCGEADILLSFELAEAYRWLHWLKADGQALINNNCQEPPVVNLGLYDYPDNALNEMKKSTQKIKTFDATSVARDLGNPKLVNTVMLAAASAFLPFEPDIIKNIIVNKFKAYKPHLAQINSNAFDKGIQL
ncbi:MAG: indolepyruvate oxidoreductase subunit beta [Gammaproteobacteria bacterium]|nr:MAG: indolepyruvate oxidoreductase subunit beta [Gammaproteobacteria bacterium]